MSTTVLSAKWHRHSSTAQHLCQPNDCWQNVFNRKLVLVNLSNTISTNFLSSNWQRHSSTTQQLCQSKCFFFTKICISWFWHSIKWHSALWICLPKHHINHTTVCQMTVIVVPKSIASAKCFLTKRLIKLFRHSVKWHNLLWELTWKVYTKVIKMLSWMAWVQRSSGLITVEGSKSASIGSYLG